MAAIWRAVWLDECLNVAGSSRWRMLLPFRRPPTRRDPNETFVSAYSGLSRMHELPFVSFAFARHTYVGVYRTADMGKRVPWPIGFTA
jgi:hypothetical protein